MDENKITRAVLLRLGGRSYQEIADEMGCSKEMVRRYLRAGEGAGLEMVATIRHVRGLDPTAAAVELRRYLDGLGLRKPIPPSTGPSSPGEDTE